MNKKNENLFRYKRTRALMGTFVSIEYLNLENNFNLKLLNNITNKTFQLIQNLAKKIRTLDHNSTKLKKEFSELLDFCENLQIKSENAFIYKINDKYDLDGVAKGYIIDKSLVYIFNKLQYLKIKKGIVLINAGGDISYKKLTDKSGGVDGFRKIVGTPTFWKYLKSGGVDGFRKIVGTPTFWKCLKSGGVDNFRKIVGTPTFWKYLKSGGVEGFRKIVGTPTFWKCLKSGGVSYKNLIDKKYLVNLFKFIFSNDIKVLVRMGEVNKSIYREIKLIKNSIASSSINVSLKDKKSTTNYYNRKPKRKLNNNSTVVVQASNAMIADALTKVLLFASVKIVKKILKTQNAIAWVFDKNGKIIEEYI